MAKYKLASLPKNTVCEFAHGKYIWQTRRMLISENSEGCTFRTLGVVTEVFELSESNEIKTICTGRLMSPTLDSDACFYIQDENNRVMYFKQEYAFLNSVPTNIQAKLLIREKEILAAMKEEAKVKG